MARGRSTFIVVSVAHDQQIAEILAILRQFRIQVDVMERRMTIREPRTIALQITRDRLAEAVLALEFHGYREVRAYELDGLGRPDRDAAQWSKPEGPRLQERS